MERVFTYGTLQYADVQQYLLGRCLDMQPDHLQGFRAESIHLGRRRYPIAVPDPHQCIHGQVVHVRPQELGILDHYETAAYERIQVTLASGCRAWVYTKSQQYD